MVAARPSQRVRLRDTQGPRCWDSVRTKHTYVSRTLNEELGRLRRDVYNYMLQHDPAWTRGVEAHIRQEKGGGGIGEASLMNKVEAGIFARVIQDIEDACLDKSRRVLRSSGWTARSWQQDGLLVEGEVGIEAGRLTENDQLSLFGGRGSFC